MRPQGHEVIIRAEHERDQPAIREIHRLAFGQEAEGRLVDALRAEGYARLSLVAEEGETLVGHILFSVLPIVRARGTMESMALAPVAVVPGHQGRGIGSALIQQGLQTCAQQGHPAAVVVGHPAFYQRFGFSAALAERLKSPFTGPAFMALELVPGALADLDGEVRYPPPFEAV